MIVRFMLLVLFSMPALATVESGVNISVVKFSSGNWTVTYQTNEPVYKLAFIRNPDNSRVTRWRPTKAGFEVISHNGLEYVIKKDGSRFTKVSLSLTPTYKHLIKDYAPFSPYSDGGMIIHTGRLFACMNVCHDDVNAWRFSIQVPKGEHVIVNGKIYESSISWLDANDGMNVYVGSQKLIETENVIAVIDNGLPERIKHALEVEIPKLMDYFELRLGRIHGVKPMLFASYANVKGGSSQGGTFPHQIFMHWNMNTLDEQVKNNEFLNNTIWFFAHEVAHLYQRGSSSGDYGDKHESWLHEGHADWLAALALQEIYPDKRQYVKHRIDKIESLCIEGLAEFPLVQAADKGRFDLYYKCGLLIHRAVDLTLQKKSKVDTYSLWVTFREQIEKGDKKGSGVFLALVEKWGATELALKIKILLEDKVADPRSTLTQLMSDT